MATLSRLAKEKVPQEYHEMLSKLMDACIGNKFMNDKVLNNATISDKQTNTDIAHLIEESPERVRKLRQIMKVISDKYSSARACSHSIDVD